jgi:hypothetical protein
MKYQNIPVNHLFFNLNRPETIYLNAYAGALILTGKDKGIFERSSYFNCGDNYIDLGEFKYKSPFVEE